MENIMNIYKADIAEMPRIQITEPDDSFIDKTIVKKSAKPFKSGSKLAIIKGFVINEHTEKLCFVLEDKSIVECFRCKIYDK